MAILPRMMIFFCLSVLLHLVLLFALPDISRLFTITLLQKQLLPERKIEVELVKPTSKKMPLPTKDRKTPDQENPGDLVKLAEQKLQKVLSLGDLPVPAVKSLELPASRSEAETTINEIKIPSLPAESVPDLVVDFGTLKPGFQAGDEQKELLMVGEQAERMRASEQQLLTALQAEAERAVTKNKLRSRILDLEGPVARFRKVIFKPKLPEAALRQATEIKLKFWVRPDGTVSRIEPLIISDLSLVRIAEVYLQAWRFNTLSPDLPQKEQWGTITIRFRLKK